MQGTEIPVVCLKLRFNNRLNDCLVVVVFLIVSDPSHRQVKLGYKRIRGNDPPPPFSAVHSVAIESYIVPLI